jgi:hypothetical protein
MVRACVSSSSTSPSSSRWCVLHEVTVPTGRYTQAEVSEIEAYMQTLTVQAKAAQKLVDPSVHLEL